MCVIRQLLLGLQVWVGPLLEKFSSQAGEAKATCCVERTLTLKKRKRKIGIQYWNVKELSNYLVLAGLMVLLKPSATARC